MPECLMSCFDTRLAYLDFRVNDQAEQRIARTLGLDFARVTRDSIEGTVQ